MSMGKLFPRALALWLPLACAICGVFIFSYWAVQQNYRGLVNDPQVQLAEDAAIALSTGASPVALTAGKPTVDIRVSLAPWIAVYDAKGVSLASTGMLDGAPVNLPAGVFDTSTWRARVTGYQFKGAPQKEIIFSWQPRDDVRQAVSLVALPDGRFVASGRSLREAEQHIATLTQGAVAAWGITELGTLIVIVLLLALGWL